MIRAKQELAKVFNKDLDSIKALKGRLRILQGRLERIRWNSDQLSRLGPNKISQ